MIDTCLTSKLFGQGRYFVSHLRKLKWPTDSSISKRRRLNLNIGCTCRSNCTLDTTSGQYCSTCTLPATRNAGTLLLLTESIARPPHGCYTVQCNPAAHMLASYATYEMHLPSTTGLRPGFLTECVPLPTPTEQMLVQS